MVELLDLGFWILRFWFFFGIMLLGGYVVIRVGVFLSISFIRGCKEND